MSRTSRRLLLVWLLACLCGAGELRVGLGRSVLPHPDGGPLAGYGGWRDRRAEAVLDAPDARALVLDRDGLRVALISLDLVIVRPILREEIRRLAETLELDTLIVIATHTHSGPGGYIPGWLPARLTSGRYQPGMPRKLAQAAHRALDLAVADLAPARTTSGLVQLALARNRRDPDGPHETALPLLHFEREGGGDPIVLFSYGAHPTVLSARSHAYSADYVGAARSRLERYGLRAIFVPGPLGDQQPSSRLGPLWPEDPALERAQVEEIGTRLAEAVSRGLRGRMTPESGTLATLERWVDAPAPVLRRFCTLWWFAPLIGSRLRSFLSTRVPIHAIRIGRVHLVTLPAEPSSLLGQQIREGIGSEAPTFVIAHANDWLGYAVSRQRYRRGGYEACMSFHGAGLGPWLVREALATAEQLRTKQPGE